MAMAAPHVALAQTGTFTVSGGPTTLLFGSTITMTATGVHVGSNEDVEFEFTTPESDGQEDELCFAYVVGSSATCSGAVQASGSLQIQGLYDGLDGEYFGANSLAVTVTTGSTPVTLSPWESPSNPTTTDTLTLGAGGAPSSNGTYVTFTDQFNDLLCFEFPGESCYPQFPTASGYPIPGFTYNVTATFTGNATYHTASAVTSFTFQKLTPSWTLNNSAQSGSVYGTDVDFTANFNDGQGDGAPADESGTVTFESGSTILCTATASNDSANCGAVAAAGNYSVTAIYSGDAYYTGAQLTTSVYIYKVQTQLNAGVSPSTTTYPYSPRVYVNLTNTADEALPGIPTGTISVTNDVGGQQLCQFSPSANGCNLATLPAGNYNLTLTYSGDADYQGSTDYVYFPVSTATTAFTASSVPGAPAYGQPVSLQASYLPASATGTVKFLDGSTTLCTATVNDGSAACTPTTNLPAGEYDIDARYSGDGNYYGVDEELDLTIQQVYPDISVSASPSRGAAGQTVTATAASLPTAATGGVEFTLGSDVLCGDAPVRNGTASCTFTVPDSSVLPPDNVYELLAYYMGDNNYETAQMGMEFVDLQATAFTAGSSVATGQTYGSAVTLWALGLPDGATGTVTFATSQGTLCSASVFGGGGSCGAGVLDAGSYSVTATYSGDANYGWATETTGFTVAPAPLSMTGTANPADPVYGGPVALGATYSPTGAVGTVTFVAGSGSPVPTGTQLCQAAANAGSASCATGVLAAGTYNVTAAFSGNANYQGTGAVTFTIAQAATSFTASAGPASTTYGNTVTLSASGLPGNATGTVSFTNQDGTLFCTTGQVTTGSASCTTATLPVASYSSVTATYSGDANYLGATASTAFTVTRAATSFTASASPVTTGFGNLVALSASGLPAGATGTVTFTDLSGGNLCTTAQVSAGSASCNTAVLPAQDYPVIATYSGDSNYQGSTATTEFTVTRAATFVTASADPSSTSYGETVTLSAGGLPANATGTVSFGSGPSTLCILTLVPHGGPCTATRLPAGSYSPVTVTYSGDGNYQGSTATTEFTVTRAATSLTASADPTSATFGNTISLSASGLAADATGTVSFADQHGNPLCTTGQIRAGAASCTTAELPAGSYSPVTATYSGDANYVGSTATADFTVVPAATSLTASAGPTSTTYGNTVTLSASGLPADATGAVSFTDQAGGALCTGGPVSAGEASCTTAALPAGDYSPVTATYSGDTNYLGSTAMTEFTVTQAATSFTASAGPSSTAYGNTVSLSASGLPTDATGTVSFTDQGGNLFCTAGQISGGSASCSTAELPAGGYSPVTATYTGDGNYLGSTATTEFTITQAATSFTASADPTTTPYGNTFTLSATGLPSDASGTVSFTDQHGSALCAPGEVIAGAATCATEELPAGSYSPVTATYSGDANHLGSTATTEFTVTPAATSFTASADPTSAPYGDTITLSASGLPGDATGTVSFIDQGGNPLCTTGQVSTGSASCTTAELPAGGYSPVTATYSGDANYVGSTATTEFSITQATTAVTASANPTSTAYGNTVTLSASGLPSDATGTVSFSDQHGNALCVPAQVSAGAATCTTAELPAGDYSPVTVTYAGDANYLGSTASTEFAITPAATSFTASSNPDSTPYGNTVTLSANGLPTDATGTVSFTDPHGNLFCTTGQVSAGAASCATAELPAGDYSAVIATYSGDANYMGSTATTEFGIAQAPTSFTASANPATTTYGNTVTLAAGGLPPDATGTVSFTDQLGNPLCTSGPLDAGAGSCTTAELPAGDYTSVTATYSGDANHLGSAAVTEFSIARAATSFTTTADPSSTSFGNTVSLSESGLPVDATGTVSFADQDGNPLCTTGSLDAGTASCTTAALGVGDYSPVTASYAGDANYLGSTALTSFAVTSDPVFEVSVSGPSTAIGAGDSYTLSSSAALDSSGGPAYQDPTLTVQLPAGETFTQDPPSPWRCSLGDEERELTCTSTAAVPIAPGTSLGGIAWTVQVAETAAGTLVSDASLADPGDQAVTAVDSASLQVTAAAAAPGPDTGAQSGWALGWVLLGSLLCAVGTLLLWRRRRPLAGSDVR